jgi:Flp pilus assembly protein TadG
MRTQGPSVKGQQLVEFALLLPLLLLLLLGIIEFGIAIFNYDTIANASREVARFGVVQLVQMDESDAADAIDQYITDEMPRWTAGLRTNSMIITPTLQPSPWRTTIEVTVTYEHLFITGPIISSLGGDPTITLRSVTRMYSE